MTGRGVVPVIAAIAYSEAIFARLITEAPREGGRFLLRLRDEWISGVLRFDGSGELLLGAFVDGVLVGVGGISNDPYAPAPGLGRIRHLYVLKHYRGRGIGRALVDRLLEHGRGHFSTLRLHTEAPEAARLYESCGFVPSSACKETHRLQL